MDNIGVVKPINIEDEMRNSYLDYAMSVIVSRALPDVRDGLKPVQRRILFAMNEMGISHSSSYKKSARIVGEVLGKYHPHGDQSVYDAMVRLAQDFSMRYMLVDGQGNFGSMDNDPAAAMRYTEARLGAVAEEMLVDIEKNTVNFSPNFDDSLNEPTVLPSRIPNLLLNGGSGIAVGMATAIPPHNLSELCDGIACLIDNPNATIEELTEFIKGPDFPTGGIILGTEGINNAYTMGHGRIVVRAKTQIEEMAKGNRFLIAVTELPYQTNKATLVERIAELVKDKKLTGISDLRDESDRQGMRIVIELKKEAQPQMVLNSLYKFTSMQSAFYANMLALVDGQPRVLSLKTALQQYIKFRHEVIVRRSQFDLKKAQDRAHILEGLKIALDHLNEIIAAIRGSANVEDARKNLMNRFFLSQAQAQAILDMQLRRLAALERKKINDEYDELMIKITYLQDLLENPQKIYFLIKDEIVEIKEKFGDKRRSAISQEEARDFKLEDLIPHQMMVVTISNRGYIKRVAADTYKLQHRGGRGVTGQTTREADVINQLLVADTHNSLLFFTNRGKAFHMKCYEVHQDSSRTSRGVPIINLISIDQQEKVTAVVSVKNWDANAYIILSTRMGEIKRMKLENFSAVRSNGLIAMDLELGDELVSVDLADDANEVVLVTKNTRSIRFTVPAIPLRTRTSGGVRGIKLAPGDELIGMSIIRPKLIDEDGIEEPDKSLLVVSENGYGKLTKIEKYRLQARGGVGVKTFRATEKTGKLVASYMVFPGQDVMLISTGGIVNHVPLEELSVRSRLTRGSNIMKLGKGDSVASIACFQVPIATTPKQTKDKQLTLKPQKESDTKSEKAELSEPETETNPPE